MSERSRAQLIKAGIEKAGEIKRQRQDLKVLEMERVKPAKNRPIDVVHVIPSDEAEESLGIAKSGYDQYQEDEEMIN